MTPALATVNPMPEPILVAIAAALAGKSVGNLYDLVKKKFASHKPAAAALEAAQGTAPDSPEVRTLSEHLTEATTTDPDFAASLQATWTQLSAATGGVANQASAPSKASLSKPATSKAASLSPDLGVPGHL
jgi:hypothetical protein